MPSKADRDFGRLAVEKRFVTREKYHACMEVLRAREKAGRRVTLAGLMIGAVAVGAALWWLGGPPQVPSASPDWERIGRILSGSHLPYSDVIYVAKGLGWLALAYLAATLVLRVTGQVFIRLADGHAWAKASVFRASATVCRGGLPSSRASTKSIPPRRNDSAQSASMSWKALVSPSR